ncbi:MAG TPA: ribosome biogenesis GTPase Der [Actinomycetota bacterium]
MSTQHPVVALVGRQNVGKSTLVNRLFGRREAIAHEQPGVTRDRIEIPVEWRGRTFIAVDTGGYVTGASGIEALVAEQARRAAAMADLVLFVVDAQTGVQEEDARLARHLQRAKIPVLVVVNKVDTDREESEVAQFHALGLGEPVAVSGLHGRSSGDLLDRILDLLPEPSEAEPEVESEPSFALVGRPNVGKSSLFNRLVGEERAVVFEQAGTTRDAVDAVVRWPEGPVRFVDTAGLRRAARMQGIDYYSLVRAARAIDRAHVGVLIIDATDGLTNDDKHVAARVIESGRALAVVANKWDLVPSEEKEPLLQDLAEALIPFASPPLLRVSALSGQGVSRLPRALLLQHGRWTRRVSTSEVNRVLEQAQDERPPPRGITRFRYGTQVSAGPPSFVLFGGKPPDATYRRFLENRLRRAFDLPGVPLRMRFRARKGARLARR